MVKHFSRKTKCKPKNNIEITDKIIEETLKKIKKKFICKCGKIFDRKFNYERHGMTCKTV
jgi:hypothetical protein